MPFLGRTLGRGPTTSKVKYVVIKKVLAPSVFKKTLDRGTRNRDNSCSVFVYPLTCKRR